MFLNKNEVSRVGEKSKQTRSLTYKTVHFYNPTSLLTMVNIAKWMLSFHVIIVNQSIVTYSKVK